MVKYNGFSFFIGYNTETINDFYKKNSELNMHISVLQEAKHTSQSVPYIRKDSKAALPPT